MNKEELKQKIDVLSDEVHKIWEESFELPYPDSWNFYRNHPKLKELINLEREYKLVQNYVLDDLDGHGDLMPLKEFVKYCKIGPMFTDYDGIGYYATETQTSDISINPSDVVAGKYRKDFTHVIWYNK